MGEEGGGGGGGLGNQSSPALAGAWQSGPSAHQLLTFKVSQSVYKEMVNVHVSVWKSTAICS